MISPTGYGIRGIDAWGDGAFGAGRGIRKHKGVDFVCSPGQNVWFPFDEGTITRVARPYTKGEYSGCYIEALDDGVYYVCKLFYFKPWNRRINCKGKVPLRMGDIIGVAQDISEKYPGMTPHIHLQVSHLYFTTKWFNPVNILEVPDGR